MLNVLVVYESMFGTTRQVAEAIGEGASKHATVQVRRVDVVSPDEVARCDVLVVGAPTHAHSMSRPKTRQSAQGWENAEKGITMEADPEATGVREFLKALPPAEPLTAAFDTRADIPELFAGSAAKAIARRLAKRGLRAVVDPESFLITGSTLMEGEIEHARLFGEGIASSAERTGAERPASTTTP
jgi:hypothetical protein